LPTIASPYLVFGEGEAFAPGEPPGDGDIFAPGDGVIFAPGEPDGDADAAGVAIGVIVGIGEAIGDDVVPMFEFPPFVLPVSDVQPAQKAAIASKANRAKVLRIEFSPVTQRVCVLGNCAEAFSQCMPSRRHRSVKV
jgi:hypothetical protein